MIPFQPLVNHLWQSTLFAALAGLLTVVLRNNRAQARYWLWLAASLKFLVPFSILVEAGSHFGWHTAPTAMAHSVFPSVIEQVSQPFTASLTMAASQPATISWIPAILCAVWAIGFVTPVSSWWLRWRSLRTALRTASPLDLNINIPAIASPEFAEPGVFGIHQPVLLLHAGIIDHLTPPQMEAILAHELCHVRRRDNLATAIHMAVEALFWFYPLVWWLGARLIDERERACDEEVLRLGSEPQVYAEGILKICELYLESPLPCVSGVTGANLKKRIEAIMSNRVVLSLSIAKKIALVSAAIAAMAAPVIIGIMDAPTIRAQSQQASDTAKFEVASVKPCDPDDMSHPTGKSGGGGRIRWVPGRLDEECTTVADLIRDAYFAYPEGKPFAAGTPADPSAAPGPPGAGCTGCGYGLAPVSNRLMWQPIKGSPSWVNSERYSIVAKADGPATPEMMRGPMMRALLEDRFILKVHRETKEVPVYELTVAQGGPKLQAHQEGNCISRDKLTPVGPGKPLHRPLLCGGLGGPDVLGSTTGHLCENLSAISDRDVVDRTGLVGMFDFHFNLAPPAPPADATPGLADPAAGLPTAAERAARNVERFAEYQRALYKLGLKLEPSKGSADFLVVDHIERPSGN